MYRAHSVQTPQELEHNSSHHSNNSPQDLDQKTKMSPTEYIQNYNIKNITIIDCVVVPLPELTA